MAVRHPKKPRSRGQRMCAFMEQYCIVPEGMKVGQPLELEPFQKKFLLDVYDNPDTTYDAILSTAKKNGKTSLIAGIVLGHTIGPERMQNSHIVSGAMSREQAALVFNLAVKMANLNPKLEGLYRYSPSGKRMVGLKANVEYKATSAEASTAQGQSPVMVVLDEAGQVRGPTSDFIEALSTAQGAYDNPLRIIISTQAPSDADFLSILIDDAIRSKDPHTVCHVYQALKDCGLMDKKQWREANPALGKFRSLTDLEKQLTRAARLPSLENSVRNLLLNQRVSLDSLWLAPSIWKANSGAIDPDVFRDATYVSLGLDLSKRNDLTAAVLSAKDDLGVMHLKPYVFIPEKGLAEKELRDKAPYQEWVKQGHLILVPGTTLDYEWVCHYLKREIEEKDILIHSVNFDRWRIQELQAAAGRAGFAQLAEWKEVGQGYKDLSPRIEHMETLLLQEKIRHGSHPLLNMAAAVAITVRDPANNRKLDKSKSTQKIDPLVAAVMSVGAFMVQKEEFDVRALIG